MARNKYATFGNVWQFKTKRFLVTLELERDRRYKYDGDDEDGETQRKLDNGEFVAFDSAVRIYFDDEEIAWDSLGSSVYGEYNVADFYTAHRDPDYTNRNCTLMRAERGENVCIGHYFPDMVRTAVKEARDYLKSKQVYIRS